MRAVLLVTKDRKLITKVAIAASPFIIGRAPDCSLSIEEPLASREHSKVIFESGNYSVEDNGSRNGTFLNEEKITGRKELRDGDEIRIGATRIKFVWDKSGADEDEGDDDKTRVASASDLEKKSPGAAVIEKKEAGDIHVKLRIVEGPLAGGVFKNWESPLTIGRGLENHVVLIDDAISTMHAQIVQEGEDYYIVDLKSSNGTFLDGVKVQKTKLSSGQKIKVGVSTLIFEMVDMRQRRKNTKTALISVGVLLVVLVLAKLLKPKDRAGIDIARGQALEQQGDLTNALAMYEAALARDPNRVEAKRDMEQVKEEIEASGMLSMASQAAADEDYDKAKDLCDRVLRDFPDNTRAQELQAVIGYIENAQLAFQARNWSDAKQLLEKAQGTYPQSELLRTRLDKANSELTAQQNLAQAKADLDHQQMDMAEPLLQSIPTTSVYYVDAKQALDQIEMSRQIAQYLSQATSSYQNGDIAGALKEIDAGLQQSPNAGPLLDLQNRVRQMNNLAGPLQSAEATSAADDVPALLQEQQTCQSIINLESDPLNTFRKRAEAAETRIAAGLAQAASANAAKGADALQAGNEKDAIKYYNLAAQANPNDTDIASQRQNLLEKVQAECKKLYDQGIIDEQLQQNDQAHQAFQKVLDLSSPGEHYYDLANAKLKDLMSQ